MLATKPPPALHQLREAFALVEAELLRLEVPTEPAAATEIYLRQVAERLRNRREAKQ